MEGIATAAAVFVGFYAVFVAGLVWAVRTAEQDPDDPSLMKEFYEMTHDPEHTLSPRLAELKAEFEAAYAAEQTAQAAHNGDLRLELEWEDRHGELMAVVWRILNAPTTSPADLLFKVDVWELTIRDPIQDSDDVSDELDFTERAPFKLLAEVRQVLGHAA